MSKIKSAVESFVKRAKEEIERIPKGDTSFSDRLVPNPLLRTDSSFRRGLERNDPELRKLFESKELTPEDSPEMVEAIDWTSNTILSTLEGNIEVLIETYRTAFNSDPALAVEDIKKMIDSVRDNIVAEITAYDNEIKEGKSAYHKDADVSAKECREILKELESKK